jgi:hypothetical protein
MKLSLRCVAALAPSCLLVCLLCLVAPPLLAQTVPVGWVKVTAANTMDAGVPIANGTVAFTPVDVNGKPTSFRVGSTGGGQAGPDPITAQVTNGAFSVLLPDVFLATPAGVCYSEQITDNSSGDVISGPGYRCLQPAGSGAAISGSPAFCTAATASSGGLCNFDQYTPTVPASSAQVAGGSLVLSVNGVVVGVMRGTSLSVNGAQVGLGVVAKLTQNGGTL